MFEINKQSDVPLYQQLIHEVKKYVDARVLKENDKLPSESEICREYNLSRTIVRMAMNASEKEGYIYKLRGKGSYVSSPKIYQDRSGFSKFYDDMRSLGKVPVSKILYVKVKEPNEHVRAKMNLAEGDLVVKLVWIRYGNQEPLIYETIYFNYSMVQGIENMDLTTKKLYDILADEFGIKAIQGKELFYPCKIGGSKAKHLMLDEGELGMKVERTVYHGNKILEYTQSTVRGDRFVYMTSFAGSLKK